MQSPKNPGVDRVRVVLSMRVTDVGDLLRFSASIADFSGDELIRLARELPGYGGESLGSGSIIRPGEHRSDR
jgi:hypothetical protein